MKVTNGKKLAITDFLTSKEIDIAIKMFKECEFGTFAHEFSEKVIKPVLPRINKVLGQENDPLFLAYAVEYVLTLAEGKHV